MAFKDHFPDGSKVYYYMAQPVPAKPSRGFRRHIRRLIREGKHLRPTLQHEAGEGHFYHQIGESHG